MLVLGKYTIMNLKALFYFSRPLYCVSRGFLSLGRSFMARATSMVSHEHGVAFQIPRKA